MNREQPSASSHEMDGARLDKWLWMMRVFKTRELAAEACRLGRVEVNGREAKPAHGLRAGQVVEVRQGAVSRRLVVLGFPRGRQGAAAVAEFMRDETPPEVYAQAAEIRREQHLAGGAGKSEDKRERRERRALWGEG